MTAIDISYKGNVEKISNDMALRIANSQLNTYYTTWHTLSLHRHLSEDFIREFKDKVDWFCVSTCQHLSEDFIREFKDRVNWNIIARYQKLSKCFIDEYDGHFLAYGFNFNMDDSWHKMDTESKKQAVKRTGLNLGQMFILTFYLD